MENNLFVALSKDGFIRVFLEKSTHIVERARDIHKLSVTTTATLGRILIATSLMGKMMDMDDSSVTVRFQGDGPIGNVLCVSDNLGNVRGYCDNPDIDLPSAKPGKINVGGSIGQGLLHVTRDLGMRERFTGTSEIVTGEIAEDIANYFVTSEQVPTVCSLGVRVEPTNECSAAGGFILQLLPGYDESVIDIIEKNIQALPKMSDMVLEGLSEEEIFDKIYNGIEYDIMAKESCDYKCTCSRERYFNAIASLPKEDLEELANDDSDEGIEAVCHFCGEKYTFSTDDIKNILK